jgi:DNA-binding transcriptional MerR regulator
VDVVLQIKGLLEAGLPPRIIQQLLPCLDKPQTIYVPNVTPEMIATLQREQARLPERIEFLTRNRDAIADYLDTYWTAMPRIGGRNATGRAVMRRRPRPWDRSSAPQRRAVGLCENDPERRPDRLGTGRARRSERR